MKPKWSQDGPKSKTKTMMKKEALQDRLGAVLGRSWVVLGAVLGLSWGRRMGFRLGETAFRENQSFSTRYGLKTCLRTILGRFGCQKGSKMEAFWDLSWGKEALRSGLRRS